MRTRYRLGDTVDMLDPLPGEPKGPWRIVGVTVTRVPTEYKLAHYQPGKKPLYVTVEEPEITPHTPPKNHTLAGAHAWMF